MEAKSTETGKGSVPYFFKITILYIMPDSVSKFLYKQNLFEHNISIDQTIVFEDV